MRMKRAIKRFWYYLQTYDKPRVIVVCGPTASGKTSLALSIAKELKLSGRKCEIVSADSRQIYEEIPNFSGAIARKDQQNVPHHFVGTETLETPRNVWWFRETSLALIKDIRDRSACPLVVGGTGFWIQALLFKDMFPEVPVDASLRKSLSSLNNEELEHRIRKLDPEYLERNKETTTRRLIRAIEIATALGKVPERTRTCDTRYRYVVVYLDLEPQQLHRNITKGVSERLYKGMQQELVDVFERYGKARTTEIGLGFKAYRQYVTSGSHASLMELISTHEKQYAKRQKTFFRKMLDEFPGPSYRATSSSDALAYLQSCGYLR